MRERSRVEAEWLEPDRTRRVLDLRKVESKESVVRSVTISSSSEDSEGSVWNRVAHPRRSVLGESGEDERVESKRAWGAISAGKQKARAVKLLKDWGLKFSGDEREDPEEFLKRLSHGATNARSWGYATCVRRWVTARRFVPTSSASRIV